jgi:hypothetical protein
MRLSVTRLILSPSRQRLSLCSSRKENLARETVWRFGHKTFRALGVTAAVVHGVARVGKERTSHLGVARLHNS